MKPPRYPLPVWLITDANALRTATIAVRRVTTHLAIIYWLGGCTPFPIGNSDMVALAGVQQMAWDRMKERILKALAEICPLLDDAYVERDGLRQARAKHMERLRAARRTIVLDGKAYPIQKQIAVAPQHHDHDKPGAPERIGGAPQRRGSGVPAPTRAGMTAESTFHD